MNGFAECARKHFDFLVHDYGFVRGGKQDILPELSDSATSVRYEGPHLFIWVHVDKDQVCAVVFAKVHTSVLRPAARRSFYLDEILRQVSPKTLEGFPQSETPDRAPENFEDFLRFYAAALRKHCGELLRMDLKLLEDICVRR